MMNRNAIFVLFVVMLLFMSACQTNTGTQSKSSGETGKLVLYSAGPGGVAESLKDTFTEQTGIEVEMFQGTTGAVLGRLEAEKDNPQADVVIVASWPAGRGIVSEGWSMAYPEAKLADKLHWVDEDRHLFGVSASALGLTFNTDRVDQPPQDWSDLADPKWADEVNIPDPTLSGSALDFVSGYLNAYGDDGWSLFESLKENGLNMAGANKEALDPVKVGSKSAVMAGVDYMAYSAKANGELIDIVYPESGTVINPRPALILKDSANVDSAKTFIDFLISDDAQELMADAYLLPGRTDFPAKDRAGVDDIPLLDYDWDWMEEHAEAIGQVFMNLFR